MPRRRQPARLWLRRSDKDRGSVWVILDAGRQIATGCGAGDIERANERLRTYLAEKASLAPVERERHARDVTIAEVLRHYVQVRGREVKQPKALASRITFLLNWWGERTLDDVDSLSCGQYANARTTKAAARRELEDLRAAVRLAVADKLTRSSVTVTLPPPPARRSKFLEPDAVAKLLWAAHRKRESQTRHRGPDKGKRLPTSKKQLTHVARFILTALYTGSRAARVWQASFEKEVGRPWVDLESGHFHRSWEGEHVPDNKRAPSIRLPPRLLAHMRRWRRMGARYVVEYEGRPADPKKAFRKLADEVLGPEAEGVVRHTFRHTAITWLMRMGEDLHEISGFTGVSRKILETVYGHHHPDHQKAVGLAFSRGRAARMGGNRG